jgi:hypothetical protein
MIKLSKRIVLKVVKKKKIDVKPYSVTTSINFLNIKFCFISRKKCDFENQFQFKH